MKSTKGQLRDELKIKRGLMTGHEISAKSRMIAEKLLAEVSWANIKNVHIYQTIHGLKEVDTIFIIAGLKKVAPGITIVLASTNTNQPLPAGRFDVIIVPVLGFDKDNHRLGWGGGFYDKFLAGQPQALKIGVCFQSGFIPAGISSEPHDVPLDKVITEA